MDKFSQDQKGIIFITVLLKPNLFSWGSELMFKIANGSYGEGLEVVKANGQKKIC